LSQYIGIRSEGGLVPYDVLDKIAKEESGLGQRSKDFDLPAGRRLTDEIARAWSDAQDYWHIFQRRAANLSEDETGATLTRKWISDLLELVGYELALQQAGVVISGKNYPISHRAEASEDSPPVQIEGFRTDLDKRPQTRRLSPQALVQEYLNNSDAQLWGVVTSGYLLRLLRDTSRTSRPSYLEFDLQGILEGNRFNEFALFYRVCHRTRFPRTPEESTSCWLEKYFQVSIEQGGRVRDKLRDGVEEALKTLGTGFLRHPENSLLRERLKAGTLTPAEFHRQLLRLVYRMLFLMVAEERHMIVPEGPEADRRQSLYDSYYSVGRLRTLAERPIESSTFGDLWIGLQQTFKLFEDGDSNPLGIPPLNGDLFSAIAVKGLQDTHLYNDVLLSAMQRLSLFEDHRVRQRVNYGALDVEELGSVYESLLDFQPAFDEQPEGTSFELRTGSERKSTGSYYTRPELVRELIESALVPVMQDRLATASDNDPAKEKEKKHQAILSITVCDPACGSGHFLLAAARRLGRELAKIRTGEDEPTPKEFHLAVRDVIAHCVYGVDVNPLAVDLCKLALWLEGHWTGKPLSFLDHRIKCGNSLIGVLDPKVLEEGVPDGAFNPVTGDDKEVAKAFKKLNRDEREGQPSLTFDTHNVHDYASEYHRLAEIAEETPAGVGEKARAYEAWRQRKDWWHDWTACNIWTSVFFAALTKLDDPTVPTHEQILRFVQRQDSQPQMAAAANAQAAKLNFFHWRLEFPEVFENGGFDLMLGNPPWERPEFSEENFWAGDRYIFSAKNKAVRDRRIAEYRMSPEAKLRSRVNDYDSARHASEAEARYWRYCGRFDKSARGKFNLYSLFVEASVLATNAFGRVGILVPTGIATDKTTAALFSFIVDNNRLERLLGYENESFIFPTVHHSFKFCALTLTGARPSSVRPQMMFYCREFQDSNDPRRWFVLDKNDLQVFNPNTRSSPVFRTGIDADLCRKVYRKVGVLLQKTPPRSLWGVQITRFFNMGHGQVAEKAISREYAISAVGDHVPMYESKLIDRFNHRFATYDGCSEDDIERGYPRPVSVSELENPAFQVTPRWWYPAHELEGLSDFTNRDWLFAYRDVTSSILERTVVATVIPKIATDYTLRILFTEQPPNLTTCLLANFNSLVFDYLARQSVAGTHLSDYIAEQLPVIAPATYANEDVNLISATVVDLVCTASDVNSFARDVGVAGPRVWAKEKRPEAMAELDAYYAHLYGLTRDELRYILDPKDVFGDDFPSETFRVLKEREKKEFGEYRTRRLVLDAFDKLAESSRFRDEMANRKSALNVHEKAIVKAGV
jgi:hypothetical protein